MPLRTDSYHPVLYWLTVLSVALFGTMIADGPHVVLGTPYAVESAIYLALLCGYLALTHGDVEGTHSTSQAETARPVRALNVSPD